VIPLSASGAVPLFFSVVVWAALVLPTVCAPKAKLDGVNVTAGAVPVPLNARLCGLPAASSAIDTLAARLPPAIAENVTDTVQLAPAAKVEGDIGQSELCAKSPAFPPMIAMLEIVSGPVPEFVSVADCAVLVVPKS
jgi:hypothetical protein